MLKLAEAAQDKHDQATAYGNLGVVYQTRGQINKAMESWKRSLTLFRQVGATPQEEQVLGWLNDAKKQFVGWKSP